jgi:hypothetical protein
MSITCPEKMTYAVTIAAAPPSHTQFRHRCSLSFFDIFFADFGLHMYCLLVANLSTKQQQLHLSAKQRSNLPLEAASALCVHSGLVEAWGGGGRGLSKIWATLSAYAFSTPADTCMFTILISLRLQSTVGAIRLQPSLFNTYRALTAFWSSGEATGAVRWRAR